MKVRIAASVVLAVGVLLGTSACNFFVPQSTTEVYDAGDGTSTDVGTLRILNAVLITEDNSSANLLVTVVNSAATSEQLKIEVEGPSARVGDTVPVGAATNVFGTADTPTITFHNVDVVAGSLAPVYFQYGSEEGKQILVPVLNSSLDYYTGLAPSAGK